MAWSNIGGSGENVKPEVDIQTPLIEDIKESLVGKATGANATEDTILEGYSAYVGQELVEGKYKPHGLYVWKKYQAVIYPTIQMESFTITNTSDMVIQLASTEKDLSEIDSSFLNGYSATRSDGTTIEFTDSQITVPLGTPSYTYDPSTQQVYATSGAGIITTSGWPDLTKKTDKTFADYVVSDSETAYPDGGLQDGYWYEKVNTIAQDFWDCIDFVTPTSNVQVLPHTLGKIPYFACIFTDEEFANGSSPSKINYMALGYCDGNSKLGFVSYTGTSNFPKVPSALSSYYAIITNSNVGNSSSYFFKAGTIYIVCTKG